MPEAVLLSLMHGAPAVNVHRWTFAWCIARHTRVFLRASPMLALLRLKGQHGHMGSILRLDSLLLCVCVLFGVLQA